MTDRPIIFSAPMVRALIREIEHRGGKTMTRRIIKAASAGDLPSEHQESLEIEGRLFGEAPRFIVTEKPIRYAIADLLWVREGFRGDRESGAYYRADRSDGQWRSPIHMPRWASRITLEVTGVKVERLQDISETDAIAEGLDKAGGNGLWGWIDYEDQRRGGPSFRRYADPRESFRTLWTTIHGRGAWEANPWVVAVAFTPHLRNIETLIKERQAA